MSLSIPGNLIRSVTRSRLADQTTEAPREYVTVNRSKLGARVPAEPILAENLGVSRHVLRQAMADWGTLACPGSNKAAAPRSPT